MFNRLTVRARIFALSAVSFVALVVVAGGFWWSQNRVEDAFTRAERFGALASDVQDLAEIGSYLRGVEKDYLLAPSDQQVKAFDEFVAKARTKVDAISAMEISPESQQALASLSDTLAGVESTFAETVELQRTLGYDSESGLRAELAASSGAVEKRLTKELRFGSNPDFEKLVRSVIEVQRAEKEFTLDRSDVSLGNFEVSYGRFERLLGKAYIPNEAKTFIADNMATYRKSFDAYTAAMNDRLAKVEVNEDLLDLMPPILDQLKADASAGAVQAAADLADIRAKAGLIVGGTILSVLVLVVLLGFIIGRSISLPLGRLRMAMERLAEGMTDVDLPEAQGRTELAAMARAVEVFRNNAIERQRLAAARDEENAERDARVKRLEGLIGGFEAAVERALASLDGAAQELSQASSAVEQASDNVAMEADRAGGAVRTAAENVTSAASATEELAASIAEVAEQAGKSTMVASRAVEGTRSTASSMAALSQTADRIGQVMGLIRDIANQTNLLALNATIEAARAGEHGKGFAVVAAEVKDLANQTATATEDIAQQVEAIQLASASAVSAIEEVTEIISEMNGIAAAVAASVEQQSGAVQSISENVANASGRSSEGANAMDVVAKASDHARRTGEEVERLSVTLAEQARVIREEIGNFLDGVRAA
ncbi:HAMP domain-containing protein [Stappia sp. F7233]|uniref:HAMP domain-containing protein n=1 Tax=Stappia albiluteola TaxID=2758565 RepID=A0A839AI27_9HYPH|nr:HAMP domain-containing protein [Stappia albiluteola]